MIKSTVYNLEGKQVEELNLDPEIFGVEIKPELIYQVVEVQQANARQTLAHAKTRSEKRGGGRKPWRQKGTGRARHGSRRSPIWVGGGVTFGPTSERNFSKKINKQMKRKALFMGLTDKVKENQIFIVDKLELPEIKTKKIAELFNKLFKKDNASVLLVLAEKNDKINRSARNLPKTKTILADSLNIVDIIKHQNLIIDKAGIKKLTATYKQ